MDPLSEDGRLTAKAVQFGSISVIILLKHHSPFTCIDQKHMCIS